MSKNRKIASVPVKNQRFKATESLKDADRYVVVTWNRELGPEGGNVEVYANMSDADRDRLLTGVMMMDKVNTNQN